MNIMTIFILILCIRTHKSRLFLVLHDIMILFLFSYFINFNKTIQQIELCNRYSSQWGGRYILMNDANFHRICCPVLITFTPCNLTTSKTENGISNDSPFFRYSRERCLKLKTISFIMFSLKLFIILHIQWMTGKESSRFTPLNLEWIEMILKQKLHLKDSCWGLK